MSDDTHAGPVQTETTSVFRADLLKEMDSAAQHSGNTGEITPPAGQGMLVVKRGANAGARFLLDQATTTAGRHPEADIFLDDVTVSRRHAEFRKNEDAYEVVDVGSLNGTYVNKEPQNSHVLRDGDEIQIGKFRLVFLAGK